MTWFATFAGIRFSTSVPLLEVDDDAFFDLTVPARWFEGDPQVGIEAGAPMGLSVWIVDDEVGIRLAVIDQEVEVRSWQLRQVAPIVSSFFDRLTLHASAVTIDGRALAFVGESGVGKSTLAAELVEAGATPLSDDLLPIRFRDGPRAPTASGAYPIEAICFLERSGAELDVRPMGARPAIQFHVENGFGEHGLPEVWEFQFDAYHRLVDAIPHVRLIMPEGRDLLGDAAGRIKDLARTGGFRA